MIVGIYLIFIALIKYAILSVKVKRNKLPVTLFVSSNIFLK